MKAVYSILILIGFSFTAFAQTNNNYPQWQHPVLQQLRANSKNLIPFYNKDSTAFVTVSVIDKKQKTIYWFDCFGYYFDAVPISDNNMQAIITKKITAFKYYDLINTDYLTTITKARANFQANGNKAIFTTYEKQLLQISDSIKFPSTLKKLIELDKQKLSVERQLREFHSINPAKIKEDTVFSKTLALQYGSMETIYKQGDTMITYYNRIALGPVYKAILNNTTAIIKYYNRGDQTIDEIQLNSDKLDLLRKEKTDVFLLYRGWLELTRYNVLSNLNTIKNSLSNLNKKFTDEEKPQYASTKNTLQYLFDYSSKLLKTTNYKIDYLTTVDRGFVTQCLQKQYQQSKNTLTPDEAYLSTFTRGQKFYELTDMRGNIMAVVTDKKIQHSTNGTTVDYYEPDIVAATDYAPFGMPLPGRNYESDKYRYGFNGKESDNEVKGKGAQYDYGFRIYDPRLGRFLSTDPLTKSFPWYTPYQFAGNKPIIAVDLDGKEELIVIRWFDGDKYLGETVFRVSNSKQREPTKNQGGDMQIIEFDISQKQNFDLSLNTKDITSISNIIKTSKGTFKGEYFKTLQSPNYKSFVQSLKEEDKDPNRHYTKIDPIPVTKTVMYDYDSKEPLDKKTLESIKSGLADDPERVIDITAYASSENNTNDPDYNKKLSQDRANTIKNYLIKNGVDKKRINSVKGAGATEKFGKGSSDENKASNRRAEITLTYKKKGGRG